MKRKRPQSASRRAAGAPFWKTVFAQPESRFYCLPELEVRGGMILTDGCRRVLDLTDQRLSLDMGRVVITLYGEALRIESFSGRRLSVKGRVARIEFSRKWRDEDAGPDDAGR